MGLDSIMCPIFTPIVVAWAGWRQGRQAPLTLTRP